MVAATFLVLDITRIAELLDRFMATWLTRFNVGAIGHRSFGGEGRSPGAPCASIGVTSILRDTREVLEQQGDSAKSADRRKDAALRKTDTRARIKYLERILPER